MAIATEAARPMSAEEKKVIFASSLGTVFEWYDFYLYGSLAAIIAKQFFSCTGKKSWATTPPKKQVFLGLKNTPKKRCRCVSGV